MSIMLDLRSENSFEICCATVGNKCANILELVSCHKRRNSSHGVTDDANVFGRHFRGGTWDAWRTFLAALFAVPLTPEQLKVYRRHTGRMAPPTGRAEEAWLVCRRRAGKSFILATIAVFLAAFNGTRRSHRQKASTHEGWSEVRAETGTRGLALPRNCDR